MFNEKLSKAKMREQTENVLVPELVRIMSGDTYRNSNFAVSSLGMML